jgi:hypothetical protein
MTHPARKARKQRARNKEHQKNHSTAQNKQEQLSLTENPSRGLRSSRRRATLRDEMKTEFCVGEPRSDYRLFRLRQQGNNRNSAPLLERKIQNKDMI